MTKDASSSAFISSQNIEHLIFFWTYHLLWSFNFAVWRSFKWRRLFHCQVFDVYWKKWEISSWELRTKKEMLLHLLLVNLAINKAPLLAVREREKSSSRTILLKIYRWATSDSGCNNDATDMCPELGSALRNSHSSRMQLPGWWRLVYAWLQTEW